MTLAAGQSHTSVADDRVEPCGQVVDELRGCAGEHSSDRRVADFGTPERQVVADRVVKQKWLLLHIGDRPAPSDPVGAADESPVDPHLALVEFDQPHQDIGKRALACAGWPAERN